MLYRRMNQTDAKLSILGFGCMRLPQTTNCSIDEPKAKKMVRYAIDHGINYFDTAYVYHNGESEPFLGRALSDGYREKVHIATNSRSGMFSHKTTWIVFSMSSFCDSIRIT